MENIKENEKLEHPKELDYFIEISGEKINKYFDLKSEFVEQIESRGKTSNAKLTKSYNLKTQNWFLPLKEAISIAEPRISNWKHKICSARLYEGGKAPNYIAANVDCKSCGVKYSIICRTKPIHETISPTSSNSTEQSASALVYKFRVKTNADHDYAMHELESNEKPQIRGELRNDLGKNLVN